MQIEDCDAQILHSRELYLGASGDLMEMRFELSLDLVVVDAQARLVRCRRGDCEQQHKRQSQQRPSQGTSKDAQSAPRVNQHSGESPGNDNPFPMMKILT